MQAKNPSRDMPIGIIGATTVCTVLYIIMCIVSSNQDVSNPQPDQAMDATGHFTSPADP